MVKEIVLKVLFIARTGPPCTRVVRALSNSELFWSWLCVNVALLLGWFLLPVLEYLELVPRVW